MSYLMTKIENMSSGDREFIGSGHSLNEMQGIYRTLLRLQSEGLIQILTVHRESTSGHKLVDIVQIEKI